MAQIPGCQREGKERRVVHLRGRTPPRCRVVPGQTPVVGCQGTALPIHPVNDVCSCCWIRAEGSGKVNLLLLPAWSLKAGPQSGHIYHPAYGIPDLQRRNWGALPSSVHVAEAAWAPTMWAQMSAGGNQGHLVFFEGPPMVEERWPFGRKWGTGACQCPCVPTSGWSFPEGEAKHFWWTRACRGQGAPLASTSGCFCPGGENREAQLVDY